MGIFKGVKSKNKITGNTGEAMAYAHLEGKGYDILETNYRTKLGEIDIIAKDKDDRIVFVEVKTRATYAHGYGREAVTPKKQQTIKRVAELYLKNNHKLNSHTRFDVIEIIDNKITHIEHAF